jgi:glycosyltransferase involved in cell wall biosynthesis
LSALIKILYIIDSYKNPYAGTEGQLLKLIQGIDKNKYEARFVVFRNSDFLQQGDFPVPVDVMDVQRLSSPLTWLRLYKYFAKQKRVGYRLAHIFFNDASMICPLLLKFLAYRVLISRRDMGYWYSRLNIPILKMNTRFVDRVIANSDAVKEITLLKEGYKTERVAVIYNGYLESEKPVATNVSQIKNDIHFGEDEIRIALVANIRPIKRIYDAIKAIKVVQDFESRVVLFVIGDGDQSQLMNLVKELGVEVSVRFLGPRDDILQLLPYFHVGILCSESEGFSNTLIEYMQSNLPVVCSSVGGNPEIVEHGINGFLYKMGDVPVLAKHLLELVMNESLREKMGSAGMEKVKNNYSMKNYIGHHQKLYEELLLQ